MAGKIVGLSGEALASGKVDTGVPDVEVDFFLPKDKESDPRIQVLGHLANPLIQMSMEAEIGEFVIRFKNNLLGQSITAPTGQASVLFIATDDPTYRKFAEMEIPVIPAEEEAANGAES